MKQEFFMKNFVASLIGLLKVLLFCGTANKLKQVLVFVKNLDMMLIIQNVIILKDIIVELNIERL